MHLKFTTNGNKFQAEKGISVIFDKLIKTKSRRHRFQKLWNDEYEHTFEIFNNPADAIDIRSVSIRGINCSFSSLNHLRIKKV